MSGLNKAIIIGRLGQDPNIKHLESDATVATFSVAISEKYKNKAGEVVEATEWLNIVIWNKLAEIVEKYVKKGMLVYIEGKIKTRNYEKDGQKHYVTEIFGDTLHMLSSPEKKEQTSQASTASEQSSEVPAGNNELDDLPF